MKDIMEYDTTKATCFNNIYKVYCNSDIFVVTHEESMGLSTLECSMAGCLIVMPKGYIKKEFQKNLHCVQVENDNYEWDDIISKINQKKSINNVSKFTYKRGVKKVFDVLSKYNVNQDISSIN